MKFEKALWIICGAATLLLVLRCTEYKVTKVEIDGDKCTVVKQ